MQMYKIENAPAEFISTLCLLCLVLSAHMILLNQPIKLLNKADVKEGGG